MHNVDLIVELYFKTHDYSSLSPAEFAKEYQRVYSEIREAITDPSKKQRINL